ncbi:hypothetical protein GCM10009304_21870 [Pseudomonas matsuisoli]|uniref:Uncharacterized protein n=1 Tax=Pseudomonas matsuisoli TaxID=1515666 RepID=A0A917PWK6_9PSED|nr:hypothetical protein GCM10009304_21870 [Pseudomonas matsuisoli]
MKLLAVPRPMTGKASPVAGIFRIAIGSDNAAHPIGGSAANAATVATDWTNWRRVCIVRLSCAEK